MPDSLHFVPEQISYRSFDGLQLHAYRYGKKTSGLSLLCLHGLTRNHKDFEPMIAALDSNHEFIAIDVRGRCSSEYDPNSQNYIPPVYVRDVLSLIEHLSLDRFGLIGTSMGGIMSMLLMPLIGEKVLGVVMNDIGPIVEPVGLQRIGNYVGMDTEMSSWDLAAAAIAKINKRAFPDFKSDDWADFARRTCRETEDGKVIMDYDPRIKEAFSNVPTVGLARFYAWRLFSRMRKVPLLLIRGQSSDLLSNRVALRMVRRHGNASLVTVSNRGHAPILNEPEVISPLKIFLEQINVSSHGYDQQQALAAAEVSQPGLKTFHK